MSENLHIACPSCAAMNRVPEEKLGFGKCGKCHKALFSAKPIVLTAQNFDAHAAKSDVPLLIDFWAAWCGPCQHMAPQFEQAAKMLEPRMRLGKLDTEAEQALAARFQIRSIPTLVLIYKGVERARTAGAMSAAAIMHWAENAGGAHHD